MARDEEKRILVAVTGASGSIYAERLIEELLPVVARVYLLASDAGRQVVDYELSERKGEEGFSLKKALAGNSSSAYAKVLRMFGHQDLFAPIASGSSAPTHMVVVPCSMGTLGRINGGLSSNLIERAADVVLKQKKPLILVPRETPFNVIHLRNMLSLAEMGVHIVPAMPAFYQKPKDLKDLVDFMVGRILELLDLDHTLYKPWNKRMR